MWLSRIFKNNPSPLPLLFVTPSFKMVPFGPRKQRGGRSRAPIVTEQETPPSGSDFVGCFLFGRMGISAGGSLNPQGT